MSAPYPDRLRKGPLKMNPSPRSRFPRELLDRLVEAQQLENTSATRAQVRKALSKSRKNYHDLLTTGPRFPFFGTWQQATVLAIAEAEASLAVANVSPEQRRPTP